MPINPADYNVLIVTERYPPQAGGVAVSCERNARALAERLRTVHVLTLSGDVPPGALESEQDDKLIVHRLGRLPGAEETLQLLGCIIGDLQADFGFHLYHGYYLVNAGYMAAFYGKLYGVRSCVSVRGNDLDREMFSPKKLPMALWTLQHADAVTCVTKPLCEKVKALSGGTDAVYAPNAVDANQFVPMPKDAKLLAEINYAGELIIGFVGELRFKKGIHFLLDAFRTVREGAATPAKLLLVGGVRRSDREFLKNFIHDHPELRPNIHAIDYIADRSLLVKYYNLMDVLVFPSLWEGMPNSILEAMACGKVVAASDAGGAPEVITHAGTGFLIKRHELDRLGEGVCEILQLGQDVRDRIGQSARDFVKERFAPASETEAYLGLYNRILEEACVPAR